MSLLILSAFTSCRAMRRSARVRERRAAHMRVRAAVYASRRVRFAMLIRLYHMSLPMPLIFDIGVSLAHCRHATLIRVFPAAAYVAAMRVTLFRLICRYAITLLRHAATPPCR